MLISPLVLEITAQNLLHRVSILTVTGWIDPSILYSKNPKIKEIFWQSGQLSMLRKFMECIDQSTIQVKSLPALLKHPCRHCSDSQLRKIIAPKDTKGQTINDVRGGLRQRTRDEFFFLANRLMSFLLRLQPSEPIASESVEGQ